MESRRNVHWKSKVSINSADDGRASSQLSGPRRNDNLGKDAGELASLPVFLTQGVRGEL